MVAALRIIIPHAKLFIIFIGGITGYTADILSLAHDDTWIPTLARRACSPYLARLCFVITSCCNKSSISAGSASIIRYGGIRKRKKLASWAVLRLLSTRIRCASIIFEGASTTFNA